MIAVADSGIGGLTLLKRLMAEYPEADFTYYADNAFAPYGSLDLEDLTERVVTITRSFVCGGVGHIVWACNTASTNCLTTLKSIYGYKISGVLPIVDEHPEGTLIMCTPRSAQSSSVKDAIRGGAEVYANSSLAGLIEKNRFNLEVLRDYLKTELSGFHPRKIILGCTHYVFLKDIIEEVSGVRTEDGYNRVMLSVSNAITPSDGRGRGKLAFGFSGKDETDDYIELLRSIK